jgi:uncharacterized protein YndB with AHSA1/START domain
MADKAVTRTIGIAAPPAAVWRALTTPELVGAWMWPESPLAVASDWTVGSPITLSGVWHGHPYTDKGIILRCVPERALSYTRWSRFDRVPDAPENYAVVAFELAEEDGATRLTVTHSKLASDEAAGHAGFFWYGALRRLRDQVERGADRPRDRG